VSDYVTDYEDFTGRTEAVFTVSVLSRVTGYLEKVHFKDGEEVNEGDLLIEIDPRLYKYELDRAEATLAQTEAHLKRMDADYRRTSNLYARGNVSREEFDKYSGDRAEAEATVGIARASRDFAKLNEEFTRIPAPISGLLSRRLVDPGNLVKADDTSLTTIVSLDPMYVYFDVDERTLLRLRRLVSEGKIPSRQDGAEIPILVALADEDGFPHKGTIDFRENKVDSSTGTLRVRAVIANPKPRVLSPGLFVRVRLPVGGAHRSILVPEQAIGTDQGKKFLYVVDENDVVGTRSVTIGKLDRGMRVIEAGLAPGENVIVGGLQRVRDKMKVAPKLIEPPARPKSVDAGPPAAPVTLPAGEDSTVTRHSAGG
jgi:RND family efflux transporter MFP subunit